MFIKKILFVTSLFVLTSLHATDLPRQHSLKQNEAGDYYVTNKEDITMIEPAIIKLGFNRNWILACVKNESIDTELIRWVFIDLRNGGTYDSLNAENWAFYRDEAYPDLQRIELTDYRDEDCP